MKGKFMIIAALLVSLTLGACVDSQESPSVTAVRTAKAEALKSLAALNNAEAKATATLAAAEAELIAAQAAYQAALAENQSIANELAAAQNEAKIAKLQAKLQKELVELQKELLTAIKNAAAQADSELASLYSQYETAFGQLLDAKSELAQKVAAFEAMAEVELSEERIVAYVAQVTEELQTSLASAAAHYEYLVDAKATIEGYGVMTEAELQAVKAQLEDAAAVLNADILLKEGEIEVNLNAANAAYFEFLYSDFAFACDYWDAIPTLLSFDTYTIEPEDYGVETLVEDEGFGFYPVKVNADGAYEADSTANIIPLFKTASVMEEVECEHGINTYEKYLAYDELQADGVAAYKDASAKMLETAAETRAYEVAKNALDAYAAKYDSVATFYADYVADKEANAIAVAANADAAKRLAYKKQVLVDAETAAGIADAYKKEKEAIDKEVAALTKEKTALDSVATAIEAAYTAYNTKLGEVAADVVAELETLTAAYEATLEPYADIKAVHDNNVELLDILVATADASAAFVETINECEVTDIALNCEWQDLYAELSVTGTMITTVDNMITAVQSGTTALDELARNLVWINEKIALYEADQYTVGSLAYLEAQLAAISVEAEFEKRLAIAEAYYEAAISALEVEVATLEAQVEAALNAIEAYIAAMGE